MNRRMTARRIKWAAVKIFCLPGFTFSILPIPIKRECSNAENPLGLEKKDNQEKEE
jgi:hypothetical protein